MVVFNLLYKEVLTFEYLDKYLAKQILKLWKTTNFSFATMKYDRNEICFSRTVMHLVLEQQHFLSVLFEMNDLKNVAYIQKWCLFFSILPNNIYNFCRIWL